MDVVILTTCKRNRPWVGRVVQILSASEFQIQWFERRNRSNTFWASTNKDGSPYVSAASVESVMFWEMAVDSGPESFVLSEYWLKRISFEYSSHDSCYSVI